MDRRQFLRSSGLVSLGGIVAGPSVWEMFERLRWKRKWFPGATLGNPGFITLQDAEVAASLRRIYAEFQDQIFPVVTPLLAEFTAKPRSLFDPPPKRIRWGGQSVPLIRS